MRDERKTKKQLINDLIGLRQRIVEIGRSEIESGQAKVRSRAPEEIFKDIFENAADGILLADVETKKFYLANKMISKMLGHDPEEMKNMTVMDIHPPEDLPYVIEQFEKQMRKEITLARDIPLKRKDGSVFYADINSCPVNIDGKIYLTGYFRDMTERRMFEERLRHCVSYDMLTGLPNRALFLEQVSASMSRAERQADYKFAVIVFDVDRFRNIIDSLGHIAGDQLLIEVAGRLKKHLRSYDTVARIEYDAAARLGGDVFTVLLSDIKHIKNVISATERLHNLMKLPVKIDNHVVNITTSIGIAVTKPEYEKPEDILRDADTAMNQAKQLGRARYVIFDEIMRAHAASYLQMETSLRQAIEKNQFLLHYQPVVLSETDKIVGFEALLRWQSPERGGVVPPSEIIPIAEETGLIIPIGRWALHEACKQMHAWHKAFPDFSHLTISVNISVKQYTPDLVKTIAQILKETGFDPAYLKLEITESVVLNNPEPAIKIFSELRDQQIKVQMDDFGTGYSSLGYLPRFPFDALKIHKSFIQSMCENERAMEIVKTIITLAHNLKMELIAEGVETVEQLDELKRLKCKYYQGYLFSKPLGRQEAEALIEKNSWQGGLSITDSRI
ncbi:MAG: EAL domain-containing protein [Nitrospirota bacterium]